MDIMGMVVFFYWHGPFWKCLQHIVQVNMDWPPFDRSMCPKNQLTLGRDLCSHLAFTECVVLSGVCSSHRCSEKQRMKVKLVHSLQRQMVRPHAWLLMAVGNTPKKQGKAGRVRFEFTESQDSVPLGCSIAFGRPHQHVRVELSYSAGWAC